jgi:shikimate kinase
MGTGKTAIGERLAAVLNLRFQDNDSRLAASSGLTPRELRVRDGVAVLHALEAEELLSALRDPGPSVISGAASVVENGDCKRALREAGLCVIWLRARAATLAARFYNEPHRPVFSHDLTDFFERQAASRGPLYIEVSDGIIDIDELSVAEAVEQAFDIVLTHTAKVRAG